jgi:hypothetical protein
MQYQEHGHLSIFLRTFQPTTGAVNNTAAKPTTNKPFFQVPAMFKIIFCVYGGFGYSSLDSW